MNKKGNTPPNFFFRVRFQNKACKKRQKMHFEIHTKKNVQIRNIYMQKRVENNNSKKAYGVHIP